MRIIAGTRRGKKILEKCDEKTRPTTDRVRENVFNVLLGLVDLNGAKVLDLFAGCGAYGLESYSRGAGEIIFNDSDSSSVEVIKKNCKDVGCGGMVLNLDFRIALEKLGTKKFDVIILDPPYKSDFAVAAVGIIKNKAMLSEGGIIVVETESEGLQLGGFDLIKQKNYGRAWLYFLG